MMLDLFGDKIPDKDMKDMLVDIDASSVRLIAIVNDFLEVSRLEQGKIDIKKENVDIGATVQKVLKNLKNSSQNDTALAFDPSVSPIPTAYTDPARLEEVLLNLIGNSMKFTKNGSITVSLEAIPNFVKVRVADTGIGISEQNQALLFRKFQQAGKDTIARDVTQGTGLGLYICRLIISALGGTIGLEKSEPGKGSTFAFTVPIR
jgi:signal transduction histidine kinase